MHFSLEKNDIDKILSNLQEIDTYFKNSDFGAPQYVKLVKNGTYGGVCAFSDIPNTTVSFAVHLEKDNVTTYFVPLDRQKTQEYIPLTDKEKLIAFFTNHNNWNVCLSLINSWNKIEIAINSEIQKSELIYRKLYQFKIN